MNGLLGKPFWFPRRDSIGMLGCGFLSLSGFDGAEGILGERTGQSQKPISKSINQHISFHYCKAYLVLFQVLNM